MNRTIRPWTIALVGGSLVAGCEPDVVRLSGPEQPRVRVSPTDARIASSEFEAVPRFDVALQVNDEPHLGAPIRLTATLRGALPTRLARIVISAPELEIARLSGGALRDLPQGLSIPAILDQNMALMAGQVVPFSAVLLIQYPGYFRVTATVQAVGDALDLVEGRLVQNLVSEEAWIYVDETGGTVSSSFDPLVFPDSVVAAPGPRSIRSTARNDTPRVMSLTSSGYSGTVRYANNNFSPAQMDPVAGATVVGEYRDWVTDELVRYQILYTNSAGAFTIDCMGSTYYTGNARLENAQVRVGGPASVPVYVSDTCAGGSGTHILGSSQAGRVWATLVATIANSTAHFARTRPWIEVRTVTSGTTGYFRDADRIDIDESATWGQYGFFVAAHEYGHAFHEKVIGGMGATSLACPGAGHWLNGAYSLQCSLGEGFADFYAAFVLQDSLSGFYENLVEEHVNTAIQAYGLGSGMWCVNSTAYQFGSCISGGGPGSLTTDGARAEAAVAAFLYDLADGPATANGSPGSDDDAVVFGGSWVGEVINSCMVLTNGLWARNDGVDHLVYCFERRIEPYVQQGYFPTRPALPSLWSSSATPPPGWSANAVTTAWQQALYPNGAPIPPPQPFTVTISGPTEVQPYVTCLYQALPLNGTPPLSYAWTADGVAVGADSPYYYHTTGANAFELGVTVTDAQGIAWNSLAVTVSVGAQECLDQ